MALIASPVHRDSQWITNRNGFLSCRPQDVPMDVTQFITALAAIVVIDVVLAGDNAIVIALAARALPAALQKRAIVWGAVGAIGVRSLMTVAVVWLLKIPGLLLAGGALLLWIAYRLLLPEQGDGDEHAPAATTFWGAMRTIVVADAAMGLDNVLAVAGAAHGSYLLVVAGLLISVPIVVWGSTVVLKIVDRYPGVVYLGAAVLVGTAVKMIGHEPVIRPWLDEAPVAGALLWLAIPAVLWAGFVKNHRRLESRIHARLAEFAEQKPMGAGELPHIIPAIPGSPAQGENAMLRVLVPFDGSSNALRALRHALTEYQRHHELELHLLNVQPRLSRHVANYLSRHDRDSWHQAQAEQAMATATEVIAKSGVPCQTHWVVGDRALEICREAERLGVHHIVMGTARKNSVTRMLEDSVTNRVLENTPVPVEVVAGDAVSRLERWGLPVGALAAVGGLVWLAVE
jgi:YjbE family integral membrane protein